eukprot:TRINITY_DN14041_c0_g1_i1.p1 TRINITY_DN14041_c0_g1~~TRINITY_DN14041_c0_g1_i1.p1  ORF type:complete len:100 (+),score=19.72 TRINITY_DN14041_c0_g1_i1:207-506(+)
MNKALEILANGKTQRTGVCNALEGLLVHKEVADVFLPMVAERFKAPSVQVNGCANSVPYFENSKQIALDEFGQEYLSLELRFEWSMTLIKQLSILINLE